MQQLENLAYESSRISEERQVVYVVNDLERLSAVSLSYGTGGGSGSSSGSGGGFGSFSGFNGKAPSGGESKPSLIGTYSSFKPASDFGIGPGIAKESDFDFIERYRAPETSKKFGEHMNLLSYLPDQTKPFFNLHLDLNDDE